MIIAFLFERSSNVKKQILQMSKIKPTLFLISLLLISILVLPYVGYAMDVTLAWDANSEADLRGYKLYYGTTQGGPYNGIGSSDGGSPILIPLSSLPDPTSPGIAVRGIAEGTYYFVVTAYNTEGVESGYSNEVYNQNAGDVLEVIPRYRLYNPNNGSHHYTSDSNEYDALATYGWIQEGIACYMCDEAVSIDTVVAVPYYRLYNPNTFEHHWTTDANEYNAMATYGWIQEGIDGYVFASQVIDLEPLYRLYNPYNGLHHWTMDANERGALIGYGWIDEGIACYVFP
jgi:hypothetical protein